MAGAGLPIDKTGFVAWLIGMHIHRIAAAAATPGCVFALQRDHDAMVSAAGAPEAPSTGRKPGI